MRAMAFVVAAALVGCSGGADEMVSDPPEPAAEVSQTPSLTAKEKGSVLSYVSGAVVRCGTYAAMVDLGRAGDPPAPESAEVVRDLHDILSPFPDAQSILKDARKAETGCFHTAAPINVTFLRNARIALETELEMIPEP